jgi:hypothetical protein
MATTWDASKKSSTITLSGGNLIATGSGSPDKFVLTVDGSSSGKFYFEVVATTRSSGGFGVGVVAPGAGFNLDTGYFGENGTNSIGAYWSDSQWYYEPAGYTGARQSFGQGDHIGIAFDASTRTIWFRKNGGTWAGSTLSADPATASNGQGMSSSGSSTYYAAVACSNGDVWTGQFASTSWTYSAPSGFSELGAAAATKAILLPRRALRTFTRRF